MKLPAVPQGARQVGAFHVNPGDFIEAISFLGAKGFLPALNALFGRPGFERGFDFQLVHSGIVPVTQSANGASRLVQAQPIPGGAAVSPPSFAISFTIFAIRHATPAELASQKAAAEAAPVPGEPPALTIVE